MKDRIPTYAGRIRLTPVDGQDGLFDMERADEPLEEGTPLNATVLLSEEVSERYELDEDSTPSDAFLAIADKIDETFSSIEDKIDEIRPISGGGTGAETAEEARENLGAAPAYDYGTADLTAGESELETGKLYFVYA